MIFFHFLTRRKNFKRVGIMLTGALRVVLINTLSLSLSHNVKISKYRRKIEYIQKSIFKITRKWISRLAASVQFCDHIIHKKYQKWKTIHPVPIVQF